MPKRAFKKGFSLGEVLLSAFLLSVGIMATVLLIGKSITYSVSAREATTAAGLAEEGVELVRYFRNNDFLVSGHDGFNIFQNTTQPRFCAIDYRTTSFQCTNAYSSIAGNLSNYYLQYDTTNKFFAKLSSARQKYLRVITVNYSSSQDRSVVRSIVYWGTSSTPSVFLTSQGAPSTNCNLRNKCVYTETILTSWN